MFFYDKDNDNGYDMMLFKCAYVHFYWRLQLNTVKKLREKTQYCKEIKRKNATECPKIRFPC